MSGLDARFPWETLRSVIGGSSAIDVPYLYTPDLAHAAQFLECYGFDTSRAEHRDELEALRRDAIAFIEEDLLDGGEQIDPVVRNQTDPRQLLVWASERDARTARQAWSCALLRVGHTLAHSRSYFNEVYGDEIRSQIFARFEPHLHPTDGGMLLGDEDPIELVDFEVKPTKPVRSVAMKLLHKVENVAEDVFDRVGVRFITRRRFDALLVAKYLRVENVFMFANVKPSRSRNTLIDLDWLQQLMHELDEEVASERMTEAERLELLRAATREQPYPAPPQPFSNPYSAASYHSIQFTCRQMIRVEDAASQREIRFFFPFEVQILDQHSYELSRSGYAAHDLYKARQREAVRYRVLRRALEAS